MLHEACRCTDLVEEGRRLAQELRVSLKPVKSCNEESFCCIMRNVSQWTGEGGWHKS
jgi:hypothetical protein